MMNLALRFAMYSIASFAALAPLNADSHSGPGDLTGSWVQPNGERSWTIKSIPGGVHLTQMERSTILADFDCRTNGADCPVKVSGHKVSVSLYYNGDALIELETNGGRVLKRRFAVQPSGTTLKVEVTTMGGTVQTEEENYTRSPEPSR